jgi:2-polyprenyl-6-methoxyphenol hydroxylase-like FAD-dependent oxidoreductase
MLGVSMSRALLEHAVRGRVSALPNVEIRDRSAVCGLLGTPGRATGVAIEAGAPVHADLVVDASGRGGGRADRWVAELGCPAPPVGTVRVNVGYTSQVLRRRPGDLPDGGVLSLIAPTPPGDKRAGAVFPIEGDRWVVTLAGWHNDHAPADAEGFAAFAAGLGAPYIADLLARAEPLSELKARQFPASRRRFFERLRVLPAGYVALGDTVCSFNPLYGQGMTTATLEAVALGLALDRTGTVSERTARAYYRAAAKVISTPWQMAAGGDFVFPETTGQRPFAIDLLNRYIRHVMLATHTSAPVYRVMLDVQHMLAPPAAVLRPPTVARALLASKRSPARRPAGSARVVAAARR